MRQYLPTSALQRMIQGADYEPQLDDMIAMPSHDETVQPMASHGDPLNARADAIIGDAAQRTAGEQTWDTAHQAPAPAPAPAIDTTPAPLPSHDPTQPSSSLHSLLSGGGMSDSLQLSSLRGDRIHELEQRAPDTVMGGGKSAGNLLQMLKGEQAADPDTGDEAHADVRYNEAIPVQQRANEIQKIGEPARVAGDARLAEEKVKGANELALGAQHDKSTENVAHITAQGRIDTAQAKPEAQPAAVRQQQYDARNVQAHVAGIRQEMENLAAHGVLGPVGGRWSEYMAGTVGSSQFTNDPEVARQLSKFRDDISLLKSGMARVHGGARGAGSPEMAKRFDNLLNSKSMDATLLNGSLDSFDDWLETYAKPGGAAAKAGAPAQTNTALPANVTVTRKN